MLRASWQDQLVPTPGFCADGPSKAMLRTQCATEAATELFAKLMAESADVLVAEAVVVSRLPAPRAKLHGGWAPRWRPWRGALRFTTGHGAT